MKVPEGYPFQFLQKKMKKILLCRQMKRQMKRLPVILLSNQTGGDAFDTEFMGSARQENDPVH